MKLSYTLLWLWLSALCLWPTHALQAQKKMVDLKRADRMAFDKARSDVRIVTGNVLFEHDSALLYCDSAVFNEVANHVEAYGNVRIRVNDTLNIFGDALFYDGKTRIARLLDNVRLVDNTTTLETPELEFDRNSKIARYERGGVIVDQRNKLVSKRGRYFTPDKQFYFRDSVRLHNPKYDIASDTLHYNARTELAEFFGETEIVSEENTILCRKGWYDTRLDISSFSRRARLLMKEQTLSGDSLYYDRKLETGEAYRNVVMVDSAKDLIIYGQFARYEEAAGKALVIDSAQAVIADGPDSLYLHADTLYAVFDTAGETEALYAYYRMKFFRTDMQGMADSLSYLMKDSLIWMLGNPVLWSEEYQMNSDSIRIEMRNEKVDQVFFLQNAFIAALEDTHQYNQLKGRSMTGFFRDNEMHKMKIFGNAETLYYVLEEDGSLMGINKAVSSDITLRFRDGKIWEMVYYTQPEAVLYPPSQFPVQMRFLEGFDWKSARRPRQAADIFRW
jgi:lipopolysaccharide export system protein LptA